jgi:hypothetical protein
MLLKPSQIVILCLLALSSFNVEARRRSRIDLPVQNTSETTVPALETTTMVEKIEREKAEAEKLEAPTTIQSDIVEEESTSESNSSEESPAYEDCDLDNISFEMITG